ncbi:MAG TPA: glycosyltransferase [Gaiellales bacterium]|nr:glycosyltransferase [Gaiellales bacterium]
MRVLIVSYYFPPAGGGGVQRVLKLCKHLPELGWDVEVLAPDDPKWSASDPGLAAEVPPATVVHRARYRGPSHQQTAVDRLASTAGIRGLATRGAVHGRRFLLPDAEVVWVPDAARAAVRLVRERAIDLVMTTSPPVSVHLIGSVVARRTGVPWVADLRDSWLANPHRRYQRRSVRAKRRVEERIARLALRPVSGLVSVTDVIEEEARALAPAGVPSAVVANGCDFDEFAGLEHRRGQQLEVLHAGSFFGNRSPRPFLLGVRRLLDGRPELRDILRVRFVGGFRNSDREWAGTLGLRDVLSIERFLPHVEALAAMKAASALLLLIPGSGGLGATVLSGKLYEYLAAERPVLAMVPSHGRAAEVLRETGFAWIVEPDDDVAAAAALGEICDRWIAGGLDDRILPAELRARLDRRARAAELADLFRRVR